MRKQSPRKPARLAAKPAVKAAPSKPPNTGLKKSDPDYYAKIGAISAKKRKLPKSFFSEMARKSHLRRTEYHGGRRKKQDVELAALDAELKAATKAS
jgi:hypothetical protein